MHTHLNIKCVYCKGDAHEVGQEIFYCSDCDAITTAEDAFKDSNKAA